MAQEQYDYNIYLYKKANGYIQNEQWEKLFSLAKLNRDVIPLAMKYYDYLPNDKKYEFIVDTYQGNGY